VTVEAVYKSWERSQGHIKARTAAARRSGSENRVALAWAEVPLADVKTTVVRAWVGTMVADELGVATIEMALGVLRQVMGAALDDNRIARNPCEGVQLPKRKHADRGYLTHAQVTALAAAVDYRPEVVRFLAYTGLRWGGWPHCGSATSTCCVAG
jgi:site-specific recombinase XerD